MTAEIRRVKRICAGRMGIRRSAEIFQDGLTGSSLALLMGGCCEAKLVGLAEVTLVADDRAVGCGRAWAD